VRPGGSRRLNEQPFRGQAAEHRPARLIDAIASRFCNERRILVIAEALEAGVQPRIDRADDLAQPFAIRLHGRVPRRGDEVSYSQNRVERVCASAI
jgi:hypothetical protein